MNTPNKPKKGKKMNDTNNRETREAQDVQTCNILIAPVARERLGPCLPTGCRGGHSRRHYARLYADARRFRRDMLRADMLNTAAALVAYIRAVRAVWAHERKTCTNTTGTS